MYCAFKYHGGESRSCLDWKTSFVSLIQELFNRIFLMNLSQSDPLYVQHTVLFFSVFKIKLEVIFFVKSFKTASAVEKPFP